MYNIGLIFYNNWQYNLFNSLKYTNLKYKNNLNKIIQMELNYINLPTISDKRCLKTP